MASESSSAVLDLNDAGDGEEEANEDAPVIMEEGYDIGVKVDSPMKQLSTLETYITYRVRCVCARWSTPAGGVRRRYNNFKVFHKRLTASHPLTPVPPLPALHSARQQLDRYATSFVAIRAVALNAFISRVAKHPILSYSEDLKLFVTTPDDEFDKVFKVESRGFNLWGLSNALYGSNEAKPVGNGPRVKDPEFTTMSDYLQSLEKKLTTLYTITNKLFKAQAGLTHELDKLSDTCVRWRRFPPPRVPTAVWTLPLSALHTRVLLDHLHHRDNTHATYVAGNESSSELKDRLEQQTEALRAEFQDWLPKTRAETKATLLEIANKQIETHKNYLVSWERALKLTTEPNMSELFKTVSKNAVHNLSPTKSVEPHFDRTDTVSDFDTSKCDDFNDFVDDKNVFDDSDSNDTQSENVVVEVSDMEHCDVDVGNENEDKNLSNEVNNQSNEGHNPSNDSNNSSNEGHNPSNDSNNSSNEGHNPSNDSNNSSNDSHKPSNDVHNPSNDSHNPSNDGYNPSNDVHNPSIEGHNPSNDVHNPSNKTYNPSIEGHNPSNEINNSSNELNNVTIDNEITNIVKSDSNTEIKRNLDTKVVTSDPLQDFADVDLND